MKKDVENLACWRGWVWHRRDLCVVAGNAGPAEAYSLVVQ